MKNIIMIQILMKLFDFCIYCVKIIYEKFVFHISLVRISILIMMTHKRVIYNFIYTKKMIWKKSNGIQPKEIRIRIKSKEFESWIKPIESMTTSYTL